MDQGLSVLVALATKKASSISGAVDVGPFIVSNPKGWLIVGVIAGVTTILFGWIAGVAVGTIALSVFGFTSAMAGNAMFQLARR